MIKSLVRYGYVPTMLLAVNGTGIWLISRSASKTWLLALLVLAIAMSFGAERAVPYDKDWNTSHDDAGRDTAHGLVNESLLLVSVAAIPTLAAIISVADIWPHSWPFLTQVLLAILAADLGITLTHYASHKIDTLWRFHAVHHSVTRMYGFNGLMKHPLHQTIEVSAGVMPLLLIGLPFDVAAALTLTVAVQLLLQHSNADYRIGALKHILALNEGHRFHHLKWAGIGDVNFGLFTLLWDHSLRTYSYDPQRRFTSDDLGMAAKPHYPTTYLAQLTEPFRAPSTHTCAPTGPARDINGTGELSHRGDRT